MSIRETVKSINQMNKIFFDSYKGDIRLKIYFPFSLEEGTFSWVDNYNQNYVENQVNLLKQSLISEHKLFESSEEEKNKDGLYLILKMSENFNGISNQYEALIDSFANKAKQNQESYSIEEIKNDLNYQYFLAKEFDNMFKMIYKNLSSHELFEDFMPLIDHAECNLDDLTKQKHIKNKI